MLVPFLPLSPEGVDAVGQLPYLGRKDPRALSSAGPSPSGPLLRPASSRTPRHPSCPTRGRGGRPEAGDRPLEEQKENTVRELGIKHVFK